MVLLIDHFNFVQTLFYNRKSWLIIFNIIKVQAKMVMINIDYKFKDSLQ